MGVIECLVEPILLHRSLIVCSQRKPLLQSRADWYDMQWLSRPPGIQSLVPRDLLVSYNRDTSRTKTLICKQCLKRRRKVIICNLECEPPNVIKTIT